MLGVIDLDARFRATSSDLRIAKGAPDPWPDPYMIVRPPRKHDAQGEFALVCAVMADALDAIWKGPSHRAFRETVEWLLEEESGDIDVEAMRPYGFTWCCEVLATLGAGGDACNASAARARLLAVAHSHSSGPPRGKTKSRREPLVLRVLRKAA